MYGATITIELLVYVGTLLNLLLRRASAVRVPGNPAGDDRGQSDFVATKSRFPGTRTVERFSLASPSTRDVSK